LNAPDNLTYEFGPFLLEPQARRLSRYGELVPLAAPEFELLLLLVRKRGQVVEKNEIMATVWPDVEVEENNLTVRMSALRRALGETKGNHQYIQTVTGRGYCLIADVKELSSQRQGEVKSNDEHAVVTPLNIPHRTSRFKLYGVVAVALFVTVLIFVVLRLRKASEIEAPAQSMKISRLTQTGRVRSAALSPDGQNIAYAERDGELYSLWLQRAGSNNPLQLLAPAKVFLEDPTFSRDGNTIYYSKCQGGCRLHTMPVFGGVETDLGVRADGPITFSPDRKRMAYVRSEVETSTGMVFPRLYMANSDGSGEVTLNWKGGRSAYQGGAPAWSPDGKVIAFSILLTEGGRRGMKVIGYQIADHTQATLIDSWNNLRDVAWLPDGSGLIVNGRNEASGSQPGIQVWRVPLNGGEARRITNDLNNYANISLSSDGSTLIALQWQWTSGLWIAPADNPSSATQVTAGTLDRQDGYYGFSVAPDGRLIYISARSGKRDLWSINADGTGLRQLTDGSHRDLAPVVSPDGRYIVFQTRRNDAPSDRVSNIWRIDADGRNPTQLTHGTYESEPAFSPDGQWVIYVAEDGIIPKLRRVPIGGGESLPVTNEFSQHPAFSPDRRVLAYYRMNQKQRDQRHVVFIPAEGGAPIKTIPAPKNWGSVMRWAPDGHSLWYRDSTLTSIWQMPLDGTPPSEIIKLRNQNLSTFDFSRDGRKLVYASGPELGDVVMITRFN
jgi:Tol biopolymer transport system component/DNA-binding winged helix-turn-helix (wHTH) protein